MARLGYPRYGAQGSDWGTSVSTLITDAERAALAALEHAAAWESGYSTQHATRPQTIGYGLVDSPAGLCAWIIEKFWA